jgi:hypothetical protein
MHATCVKVNSGVIAVQTHEGTHIFDLCLWCCFTAHETYTPVYAAVFVCLCGSVYTQTHKSKFGIFRACMCVCIVSGLHGVCTYVSVFVCDYKLLVYICV